MSLYLQRTKLSGLPVLYYINREDNQSMSRIINEYGLQSIRVSGTVNELDEQLPSGYDTHELTRILSHLDAIRFWLTHSTSDMALISEDDLSMDTIIHWPFTWTEMVNTLPYYWDILQCSTENAELTLHPRTSKDGRCGSYLIRRTYAEKLMMLYTRGSKWRLYYSPSYPFTTEDVLFCPGVCFCLPVFVHTRNKMSYHHVMEAWLKNKNTVVKIGFTL